MTNEDVNSTPSPPFGRHQQTSHETERKKMSMHEKICDRRRKSKSKRKDEIRRKRQQNKSKEMESKR